MKYILILLFSLSAHAEFPYDAKAAFNYLPNSGASFEVSNMTPTKSQDGIGLCYGFSSTSLLENYRCRELKLNCLDSAQQLSPLDVSSYYLNSSSRAIQEAGDTETLLKNFRNSPRKLAKEECAKYSSLVYKANQRFLPSEGQGWQYLIANWNEFKKKNQFQQIQEVSCTVGSLKSHISGLNTPADQLEDAFLNATSIENFLYKAILPQECLTEDKMASVPDFALYSYPEYPATYTQKNLSDKIESILLNNIPLEMSICTVESAPTACPAGEGHSIVLYGIREACSSVAEDCRTMVRVKNSYGWGWQRDNNDGWVDLETLTKASMGLSNFSNIAWMQKPGTRLENKKLKRTGYISSQVPTNIKGSDDIPKIPSSRPEIYKYYKGIWKCPGGTFSDRYDTGCVPYG